MATVEQVGSPDEAVADEGRPMGRYRGSTRKGGAEFLIWATPAVGLTVICVRFGGGPPDWLLDIAPLLVLVAALVIGICLVVRELGRGNSAGRIGNRPGPYIPDGHYDPDA